MPLLDAVLGGAIPQSVLNTMVQRMLTEMFRFGLFDNPPTGNPFSTGYHVGAPGDRHADR